MSLAAYASETKYKSACGRIEAQGVHDLNFFMRAAQIPEE